MKRQNQSGTCRLQRPELHSETLIAAVALWLSATCNGPFWAAIPAGRPLLFASCAVLIAAINFILLALLTERRSGRLLLALIVVAAAFAVDYMQRYAIVLDPTMLQSILATDQREARETFFMPALPEFLFRILPPLGLILSCRLRPLPLPRALAQRLGCISLSILLAAAAMLADFHGLSTLLREKRAARYLVTPANFLYSSAHALLGNAVIGGGARRPIGLDAALGAGWPGRRKPLLFVVVVGETVRAASWGLAGYVRQTTPLLAANSDLVSFAPVQACGTSTAVSLPCMFSPWGRRDHDATRTRNSESLLHVFARAGFRIIWLDNQSGCKGVCAGLEEMHMRAADDAENCPSGGECYDGALVSAMRRLLPQLDGNTLLVLHQIGNHGPAYHRRYPAEFARFQPACSKSDPSLCSRQEVINAYDNALLYTDHLLDRTIALLRAQPTHSTGLLYVSDHGESLGENGIFLHGMPYFMAPVEQREVPMLLWLSKAYLDDFSLDLACLQRQTQRGWSHDDLFHSLLGLGDVHTALYQRSHDISAACRAQAPAVLS